MTRHVRTMTWVLACLSTACGPTRRTEDPACTKGETKDCSCANGLASKATCLDDGSDFGACACEVPQICAAAETKACTCADGASGTMTCNADRTSFGACQCAKICEPQSAAECRCENGQSGLKACNETGTGYGACACEDGPVNCTAQTLTAAGGIRTSKGNVGYEGQPVTASFSHRHGTGGGCLANATLQVALAGGACVLSLDFGAIQDGYGGLLDATLDTTGCPSFGTSGAYSTPPGYAPYWFTGTTTVVDGAAQQICVAGTSIAFPSRALVLKSAQGAELTLNLSGLTIVGQLSSSGDAGLTCVDATVCRGAFSEDATAWCVRGCGSTNHDGGDGTCLPLGQCISGFHDDGTGKCVPKPECAGGFHDGGDGACVAGGTCSPAFLIDAFGNCIVDPDICSASPPKANAGGTRATDPNVAITLDGRASQVTNVPATYEWTIQSPGNATATLGTPNAIQTTFNASAAGRFGVTLKVTDARGCISSDSISVRVGPGPKTLEVTVTWAEPSGDLDVHFLGPNGSYFDGSFGGTGGDAYYANLNPDWGLNGSTSADGRKENDPNLVQDDLWGEGPEKLVMTEMFDGSFTVGVHYYCDATVSFGVPAGVGHATATVTVRVDGVVKSTLTHVLTPKVMWNALRLDVSGGGTVVQATAIDTLTNDHVADACP